MFVDGFFLNREFINFLLILIQAQVINVIRLRLLQHGSLVSGPVYR